MSQGRGVASVSDFQLVSDLGNFSPDLSGFLDLGYSLHSKLEAWKKYLAQDIDKDYILEGVAEGFRLSYCQNKDVQDVEVDNHHSSYLHRQLVEKELIKQLGAGHYVFTNSKPKIVSPLGAILKEDGKSVRLIHDGSLPIGKSMNDYSGSESVKYETLDLACEMAKPGWYMAKVDLRAAYRSVSIHPDDYCTTGVKWQFQGEDSPRYLFDTRLPFGSRLGPCIFTKITQAVKRIMHGKGFRHLVVYLDDFLILCETQEECARAQNALISVLTELGFIVSWEKVVSPTRKIVFLGVTIDTMAGTLSLDEAKLNKVKAKLQEFRVKKRATKRQLQSVAGLLNWACQAVKGGRFFLRRIIDAVNKLKGSRHKIQLTMEFKLDIQWWLDYLEEFNGVVYIQSPTSHVVLTDASTDGAGMFYAGDWQYIRWEEKDDIHSDSHINNKEIMSVVYAAHRWAEFWSDSTVLVCTDNVVTKAVINKGTCKNSSVMQGLRGLFWLSVKFNFKLRAIHIPGVFNSLADAISRLHSRGQVVRVCNLLCSWHHGVIPCISWRNHMSPTSFQMLEDHLQQEISEINWPWRC